VALALLVIGIVLLVLKLRGDRNTSPAIGRLDLAVVTVQVDRAVGQCPLAVFNFTATVVASNGDGQIRYRWDGPEVGTTRSAAAATVRHGRPDPPLRFMYTVRGQGATSGDVTLHILAPADRRSSPVHIEYSCP
jgi:hypothetical protein